MYSQEERLDNIRMIRDSAAAFAPAGDLSRVRGLRYQPVGFDRNVWNEIAQSGWVGLTLDPQRGGSGLGKAEYCALLEVFGAALIPEPFVPAVLGARLLEGELLAQQMSGDCLLMPALQELNASLETVSPVTQYRAGNVCGRKINVPMGAGAEQFLISTPQGLALVEAGAAGLQLEHVPTQDGGVFTTLCLQEVQAQLLPLDSHVLQAALDEAALGTAAYLLGVAEQAFRLTLEYLGTRRQFDQAIGSFQALQHRAVDMKLQLALWRASLEAAAAAFDNGVPVAQRQAAVSRVKARAADASLLITRQAVQMHGAIGYTDECDIGLYLRKAMTLANLYGSSAVHRRRYDTCTPGLLDV